MGPVNLHPNYSSGTTQYGDMDMGNKRIRRLAPGVDPTDAVNLQQLLDNVPNIDTSNFVVKTGGGPQSIDESLTVKGGGIATNYITDASSAQGLTATPININADLVPTFDREADLGKADHKWRSLHAQYVDLRTTGGLGMVRSNAYEMYKPNGDVAGGFYWDAGRGYILSDVEMIPPSDATYDVGDKDFRYADGYFAGALTAHHLTQTGVPLPPVFPANKHFQQSATITYPATHSEPAMKYEVEVSCPISGDLGSAFSTAGSHATPGAFEMIYDVPDTEVYSDANPNTYTGTITTIATYPSYIATPYTGEFFDMSFSTAKVINRIGWTISPYCAPCTWTILGGYSFDDTHWTVLQTKSMLQPITWGGVMTNTFDNAQAFKRYRVVIHSTISQDLLVGNPRKYAIAGPVFYHGIANAIADDVIAPVVTNATLVSSSASPIDVTLSCSVSDNRSSLGELIFHLSTTANPTEAAIRASLAANSALTYSFSSPTVGVKTHKFTTGLNEYTTYYGSVLAEDTTGNVKLYQNADTFYVITPDLTPPVLAVDGTIVAGTIVNGSSLITGAKLTVNWTASDAGTGLSFICVRCAKTLPSDDIEFETGTVPLSNTATSYTFEKDSNDLPLTASTTYYITVQAWDYPDTASASGGGSVRKTLTSIASGNTIQYTTPAGPVMSGTSTSDASYFFVDSPNPSATTLRWNWKATHASQTSVSEFYLYCSAAVPPSGAVDLIAAALKYNTSYTFGNATSLHTSTIAPGSTALIPDTTYFVVLLIIDSNGFYVRRTVMIKTKQLPVATAGTPVAGTPATTAIDLPWTASDDEGISAVWAYCGTAAVPTTLSTFQAAGVDLSTTAGSGTKSFTGLTSGTAYNLAIMVIDTGGNYKISSTVTRTTEAAVLKQYPPKALTSANMTISGEAYGNGTYIVTKSSEYPGGDYAAWMAFDRRFVYGAGVWTPSNTTLPQWIAIELPSAITLQSFALYSRIDDYFNAPDEYRIYGVNGAAETAIFYTSDATPSWTNSDKTDGGTIISKATHVITGNPGPFSKYKLEVLMQSGSSAIKVNVYEWELWSF